MLSITTGRAKCGKTDEILKLLKNNAASHTESLLFVPEQFSFNAEKMILNSFSEHSDKITVVSFTSFCNELKRLYGGNAGKVINDSARIMFVRKAIIQLEGELQLFKSSASAINSIDTILSAITEFKQAAVSPEELNKISDVYKNTLLGMKLHDIALIMSTYDALILNKYIDPNDDLDIAYNQAKKNGYFCDKAVYFDAYSGFTGQQYNIIKQALNDSPNVAFAFCTDNNKDNEFGIFANVNNTIENILNIADNLNLKEINRHHIDNGFSGHKDLKAVEEYLAEIPNDSVISENLIFAAANSKYSELEFIASEIHKLVRTDGYRYRDFAVITGNCDEYTAIAESVFSKLNVPIYLDKKLPLIETPVANFILSALRAAKNYSSTEIIKFLKTGLTDFSLKEITDLDEYVYLWNIRSDEWKEEWKKNPFGLTETAPEKSEKKLSYLNDLKDKIISNFKYFNSVKTSPASDLCKKLFRLLEKCNVAKNLARYVKRMQNEGNYDEAQYIISSWECVLNTLDDIVGCYSDDEISLREFTEILEFSFKKHSIGGIPQGLDEVCFTSAKRTERSDFKVAFVFALNYGQFPDFNSDGGLFNVYERGELIGNSVNINDTYISSAIEENYCVYKALTSPNEKLYLSYHYGDYSGKSCEPSAVFASLVNKFSGKVIDANLPNVETVSQAFSLLSEDKLAEKTETEVKEWLQKDNLWKERLEAVSSIKCNDTEYIDSEIARKLYGDNSTTTASKIEQYYKCPYAYFLKFGLNISKPMQIDFKRMQRGQIVHYVLERFIKEKLDDFEEMNQNRLQSIINEYIEQYIKANVGSVDVLDNYSKFILKRILELLVELVPWICNELANSEFKPQEYEYNLNNDEIKPIEISGKNGSVRINGIVDRFDIYSHEDMKFIRIVDYKTGVKKIKLADILYGLNLQMFIYISAICESDKFGCIPAGVLYQPINHIVRKGTKSEISDFPKASGVLTSDVEILKRMDPKGEYMPFKLTKSGSPDKRSLCISPDDFKEIFKFIKSKIINMNDNLLSGKISKDPCDQDSSHRTCDYCDYKELCGRNPEKPNRVVESISTEDVLKMIEKENCSGN